MGALADEDGVGFGQGLEPCRQIRRLSDDGMFARDSAPNDIANYDQARGNADAGFERLPVRTLYLAEAVDNRECGINRTFRCILLGLRITKIGEHTVAHELGDESVEPSDCPSACVLVALDQRAHVFRIDLVSQCGRTDQVGKQYRDLASFRFLRLWRSRRCF